MATFNIYGHHAIDFKYSHVGYPWIKHEKGSPPQWKLKVNIFIISKVIPKKLKLSLFLSFWPIFNVKWAKTSKGWHKAIW